jgi:hypothetical protein
MLSDEPFIDRECEGLTTTKGLQEQSSTPFEYHHLIKNPLTSNLKLALRKITTQPERLMQIPHSIAINLLEKAMPEATHAPETLFSQEHGMHQKQFELLDRLLHRKNASPDCVKKVLHYAEDLLFKGESARLKGNGEKGQDMTTSLGKLLFFIDRSPLIPPKHIHKEYIDKFFKEEVKSINDRLDKLQKLSSGELVRQTALPTEIAAMLIMSDGALNPGIIPLLIETFIPQTPLLHNYALSLKGGLQLLQQSSSIKELLESIPLTANPSGKLIVNVALQHEKEATISLQDQKIAILSAFFTHLRQGKSGNCFASFIAIEQQAMHPEQALKDLIQLVVEGGLTREVQGSVKHFPYLVRFGMECESSPTFHPLLRVWENSIAGMSEAKSGGLLNTALMKSFCYLFEKRCKRLQIRSIDPNYGEKLEHALEKKFIYLYDPTNHTNETKGYSGAFILHERTEQGLRPILSSGDFFIAAYQFIIDVFGPEFAREEQSPKCQCILLRKLLKYYHPSNADLQCNPASIEVINYTPWKTAIGNNPKMAFKIYTEGVQKLENFEFKPHHAEDLMKEIHHLLKAMPKKTKQELAQSPMRLTPMRIPGMHAFSMILNHPSILPYYDHFMPFPDAEAYAKLPVLKSLKRKVIEKTTRDFIPKDKRDEVASKLKKGISSASIQEFRDQLITHLKDNLPAEASLSSVLLKIDKWIYEALPLKKRLEIDHSIIHIADSNWQEDIHDIHYGIGINPASGQIELMNVLDDGRVYKFLSQNSYLQFHTWQIAMNLDPAEVKKWKRHTY